MKKKAPSTPQKKQSQQTVLSRFFQTTPSKKPAQETEAPRKTEKPEDTKETEEVPTTQIQKEKAPKTLKGSKKDETKKEKKSEAPPPKKKLRKIIDDDSDDEFSESSESDDEIFDDNVSDEDYSSGDNESSYSSDDSYESDAVSEEENDYGSNSEDYDDILSDEDSTPKRKGKKTSGQKKATASIEDFENKSDEETENNNGSDDGINTGIDEELESLTTQSVGLSRFSNDSAEEVEINEKRHKAFVNKLRRIQSEKDAKNTTPSGKPKYTPMEQQVVEMKKRYPDCILAFEVGYKFSLYGRDAEIANEVLKVYCYQDHNFLTAMIPTVRLNFHVRRLVQAGYKVGLVRQTEVAAIKALSNSKNKPFTRSLTDLYTPATLVGSDLEAVETDLSSSRNYMVCIYEQGVDLSTGDVVYDSFKDDGVRSMLDTTLTHLSPRELLIPKGSGNLTSETASVVRHVGDRGAMVTEYDVEEHDFERTLGVLEDFYGSDWAGLSGRVTEVGDVAICLGALISHLRRFSLERGLRAAVSFRRFADAAHMRLSGVTIRNLELLANSADGGERGSLLWVVGPTSTPFGRRLLARWLTAPLLDAGEIDARLDAVAELGASGGSPVVDALSGALRGLPDLERGLSHIQHRRCAPKEFVTLMDAFLRVTEVVVALRETPDDIHSELLKRTLASMPGDDLSAALKGLLGELDRSVAENDANKGKLFLHLDHFPDVHKRTGEVSELEKELGEHLENAARQLGSRKKLTYTHMAKEEYLIELPVKMSVPKDWIKVTSTSSVSRWRSPSIADALARLQCARALLTGAAESAWAEFLAAAAGAHYAELRALVCRLAELDCLLTFGRLAATRPGYVRPRILRESEAAVVRITEGRNPVAEALLVGAQYVPNSVELAGAGVRCGVLTGPNMGGKTSLLRQVALTAVLAQAGCFVPAEAAELTPLDAIYTRMGAADCIEKGQSTYFVELAETAPILRRATPRSLVILDELGRGTSTHDGMAIAYAALWHLIRKARCLTLFVTHYTTLAQAVQAVFPAVAENFHMAYMEDKSDNHGNNDNDGNGNDNDGNDNDNDGNGNDVQKITFLYKIEKGISPSSFGLNVARIAGFPSSIIDEAVVASRSLERVTSAKVAKGKLSSMKHFAELCECLGVHRKKEEGDDGGAKTGTGRMNVDVSREMSPEDRLREIWFSVNLLNQSK